MKKTISLDFHDFGVENNNLYYIDKLREQYPNFKVSMFYIPVDLQYFSRLMPEMKTVARDMITKGIKDGWLELIPHGMFHTFGEFQKVDEKTMEMTIKAYEEHFKDMGWPYVKGFCAPNWLISKEAIKVLNKKGWFLATDRNQPKALRAKKNYIYNWDITEGFPKDLLHVSGHGHISGPSKNDLTQNFKNLMRIPADRKWKFVSEIVC